MRKLGDNLRICRIILDELRTGPKAYTELERRSLSRSPTPWKFREGLRWLCENGFVSHGYRGLYIITEKGISFLEAMAGL